MRSLVRITFPAGGLGFVATTETLCVHVRRISPFLPPGAAWRACPIRDDVSDNYALREGP